LKSFFLSNTWSTAQDIFLMKSFKSFAKQAVSQQFVAPAAPKIVSSPIAKPNVFGMASPVPSVFRLQHQNSSIRCAGTSVLGCAIATVAVLTFFSAS
jgi:hypothetical protein